MISRREFVGALALAGGVAALSFAARAQQPAMPVIGFLNSGSLDTFLDRTAAFLEGLRESGYVDGQNVAIEYRWAEGRQERLPALAAELVARKVSVIVTSGGTVSALAAKAATATIPIVFTGGGDPVRLGLVASLARPGGNVTGVTNISGELGAKRLEFLRELLPKASIVAYLVNPNAPSYPVFVDEMRAAARVTGHRLHFVTARTGRDLDAAFASIVQQGAHALLVGADPLFTDQRERLVELAARHKIPASYPFRQSVAAGGLISYDADPTGIYRQMGNYVGRILKGAKPADLPVEQPTKFELVINLKTAKALGIDVPQSILLRADEVIE